MSQILIIADDLTGACDTGVQFARKGVRGVVNFGPAPPPPSDVLVVSTHSRHLPAQEAAAQTKAVVRRIQTGDDQRRILYKKIDSTLRGNPAAEMAAVLDVIGETRVLIAPAFPAQGRTTVGGMQRVAGEPIENTVFGAEGGHSDLQACFSKHMPDRGLMRLELNDIRKGIAGLERKFESSAAQLIIADAETEADLDVIAQAAVRQNIGSYCGSAGLACALRNAVKCVPSQGPAETPDEHDGPILVVAGSRHDRTLCQVEVAAAAGVTVLRFDLSGHRSDAGVEAGVRHILAGRNVILATDAHSEAAEADAAAQCIASTAVAIVDRTGIGGLVLTGGDIAAATCTALDSASIRLLDEVATGIPRGRLHDGRRPGLPVVTKAGGFGADDALVRAVERLRNVGTPG